MLSSESTSSSLSHCSNSEFPSSKGTFTKFSRNMSVNSLMVVSKNDSDSSCSVTRGEISSNGSIDYSLEDPAFIASYIPAAFRPFMITDEPFSDVISL